MTMVVDEAEAALCLARLLQIATGDSAACAAQAGDET